MKSYKITYSALIYVLLVIVALLTGAGVGWNIYNFLFPQSLLKIIIFSIILILSLLLFVCAISVIVYSRYSFKDKKLIARFGILPSYYDLSKAIKITHFKLSNRLVLYFEDATYASILISPKYFDAFTSDVRKVNPEILADDNDMEDGTAVK